MTGSGFFSKPSQKFLKNLKMTNQQAIDILTRHNAWRRDNETEFPELPDSPVLIGEAIDAGIKALRDLEDAKDLLNEITDYNNPGFLIPKIEKFIADL